MPPVDLARNLTENRALAEAVDWNEHTKVDGEYVKNCVKKMFFDIDEDHAKLEKIIFELLHEISSLEESLRSEHQKLFITLKE